jgi:hypothetical protein
MLRGMKLCAAVLLALVGCGGAGKGGGSGLEAPPPYTPETTPEPPTRCPIEARAAREAREQAIGEDSARLGDSAAKAVFAHAECERKHFDAVFVGGGADPTVVQELKIHFQGAKNLYAEALNYQVPRWVVGSHTRLGDLYTSFATKVHLLSTPPGSGAPASPDPDVAAMDERLKMDAGKSYRAALDAAELWPALAEDDVDVAAWIAIACKGIDRWQQGLSQRYRVCTR